MGYIGSLISDKLSIVIRHTNRIEKNVYVSKFVRN
jgi:hypothetical protein